MIDKIISWAIDIGTITAIITAVVAGFWKFFLSKRIEKVKGDINSDIEYLKNELSKSKEAFMVVYKQQFELEFRIYQEIWPYICLYEYKE